MGVVVEGSTIVLSGTVGVDPYGWWYEDGFDAASVILALAEVGADNDVTIRLNSGGGLATEGSAIHSAIRGHRGKKTMVVEGIAASAAFTVAMAGDEIVVSPGATLMMHDPSGFTVGTVVEHGQQINSLNAIANSVASIYAARCGDPVDQVRAEMKAELWLTPEQAVERGFADRVGSFQQTGDAGAQIIVPAALAEDAAEPAPYAYQRYQHAPPRLLTMAADRGWGSLRRPPKAAKPAATQRQKGTSMPNENPAGAEQPGNVVNLDAVRAEGHASALQYFNEVHDLCALAGAPDKATQFIQQSTPVADIRKALLDARATASAAQQTASRITPEATSAATPKFDLAANMKARFGGAKG